MGELLRRYWITALLVEELPSPDCPSVRVKLLGEELIDFRDTNGNIGLVDEFCLYRRYNIVLIFTTTLPELVKNTILGTSKRIFSKY